MCLQDVPKCFRGKINHLPRIFTLRFDWSFSMILHACIIIPHLNALELSYCYAIFLGSFKQHLFTWLLLLILCLRTLKAKKKLNSFRNWNFRNTIFWTIKPKFQKIFSILFFSFTVESLPYFHNRHFKKRFTTQWVSIALLYYVLQFWIKSRNPCTRELLFNQENVKNYEIILK